MNGLGRVSPLMILLPGGGKGGWGGRGGGEGGGAKETRRSISQSRQKKRIEQIEMAGSSPN